MGRPDPADIIDLDRYPISDLTSSAARRVIDAGRRSLAEKGVVILSGFVKPEILRQMSHEAESLRERAHLENVSGTPYLALPDESYPEGHPRRTSVRACTWVLAYDVIPDDSPLRALYEWEGLTEFVSDVIERHPLYHMADPLGALNYALMDEGHEQGWHYDNADFVISLAVQASEKGGLFECAPFIRSADSESYEGVARVLNDDDAERVEIFPMTPGTLMIFAGRHSLHRVTPIRGSVPRHVALLAYDTKPDADTSELFKLVRYGRSAPLAKDA